MRLSRFRLTVWIGLGFCGLASAQSLPLNAADTPPLDSLTPEARYERYMESVCGLDVRTLALLAQTDCRLSELESDCYRYYRLQAGTDIPDDLARLMAAKRQAVDYRRSYIDSLYYLQALQALNAQTPDWALADKSIAQALTHNRFFVRAVLFHWTQLQRTATLTGDWTACLAYANATLPPLGWHPKVRALGDALYLKLLAYIENLMADGLYQDAITLYEEMRRQLLPEFPLFYLPHRERNLLYTAYQGIFNSYYAVAEKAFERGLYQQAQRQALSAHDYYRRHVQYMSGVDRSLLLLDRILNDYIRFMRYADEDERAYYAAMVDTVTARTGLAVPPPIPTDIYDMTAELRLAQTGLDDVEPVAVTTPAPKTPPEPMAQSVAVAAAPEVPETETPELAAADLPDPMEAEAPVSIVPAPPVEQPAAPIAQPTVSRSEPASIQQQKWSLAYAQKQWDTYVEQARLYKANRQFIAAQEAYAMGDSIRRAYPVRTSAGFLAEMAANERLCVEQLLNKAQYRLWQNDMTQSDSLYRRALALVEKAEPAHRTPLYSLLDGFEEQRKQLLCRQLRRNWEDKLREARRQLHFGRADSVAGLLADVDALYAADRTDGQACLSDTVTLAVLRRQAAHLQTYRRMADTAQMLLQAQDGLGFIRQELAVDAYFARQTMGTYVSDATTLFYRLTFEKDFPLLVSYLQVCLEDGREAEAESVLNYLKTNDYRSPFLDQLRKKSKKNRGR
ncbi:MAG: hypothetical protein K2H62_05470 [Bacteroidales bacterium]|nr:hypothetical protein [Bacteroidales bacterium]